MAVLLGKTTSGATADSLVSGTAAAWPFVAAASGDVTHIAVQTKVANAGLTLFEVGIYSNSGGSPGTLLEKGTLLADPGTGLVYVELDAPVTVASGTTYHLAWLGVGETLDFQGDATPDYVEDSGNSALPGTWATTGGPFGQGPIIYGVDEVPPVEVVAAGAVAFGAAAGTTVAPAIPAHQAGDLLVAIRAVKDSGRTLTAEANWTRGPETTGGAGSFAADTGQTRIAIDYLEATGSGTTVTFDNTGATNTVAWAQVIVLRKTDPSATWDVAGVSGTDNATGASYSVAFGSNPGLDVGDVGVVGVSTPTDVTAAHWSTTVSLTATGLTAAVTERGDAVSGNGNDIGAGTWTAVVSGGPATGNPTFAATASGTTTNIAGPCALLRVRAVADDSTTITTDAAAAAAASSSGTLRATETTAPGAATAASSGGTPQVRITGTACAATASSAGGAERATVTGTAAAATAGSAGGTPRAAETATVAQATAASGGGSETVTITATACAATASIPDGQFSTATVVDGIAAPATAASAGGTSTASVLGTAAPATATGTTGTVRATEAAGPGGAAAASSGGTPKLTITGTACAAAASMPDAQFGNVTVITATSCAATAAAGDGRAKQALTGTAGAAFASSGLATPRLSLAAQVAAATATVLDASQAAWIAASAGHAIASSQGGQLVEPEFSGWLEDPPGLITGDPATGHLRSGESGRVMAPTTGRVR